MNRERTLAAAAAGVAAVALLTAALVPGVIASPSEDDPIRPGPVDVVEAPIATGEVTGATAELTVTAYLRHRGNPARNVTVLFRAVDAESGLVAAERRVAVGELSGDREVPVNATLRVAREGGYRIETVVFRDGQRVDEGATTVRGLGALTPPYARTGVGFSEADVLPPLAVSVADAGENRTTLRVSASLTNGGDEPPADLSVRLLLRQAESNLVAARETVPVGDIRPGRTATVDAELTVPSGYNYYVDAVLLKDGVVVDTARGVANLDPQRTISADETTEDVAFNVSDFEDDDADRRDRAEPEATGAAGGAGVQSPGFGVGAAVLALAVSALLVRRRTYD